MSDHGKKLELVVDLISIANGDKESKIKIVAYSYSKSSTCKLKIYDDKGPVVAQLKQFAHKLIDEKMISLEMILEKSFGLVLFYDPQERDRTRRYIDKTPKVIEKALPVYEGIGTAKEEFKHLLIKLRNKRIINGFQLSGLFMFFFKDYDPNKFNNFSKYVNLNLQGR